MKINRRGIRTILGHIQAVKGTPWDLLRRHVKANEGAGSDLMAVQKASHAAEIAKFQMERELNEMKAKFQAEQMQAQQEQFLQMQKMQNQMQARVLKICRTPTIQFSIVVQVWELQKMR